MSIKGNVETREALVGSIHLLKKIPGYSAYEIAVKHGFRGTEKEWLESLTGYGVALENGFEGTATEWLASLKGADGYTPQKNVDYFDGEKGDPGSMELSGELDALGKSIMNVADPTESGDAANKKYVDDKDAQVKKYIDDNAVSEEYANETFIKKGSQIDADNKAVINVATPVNDTDAVNKKYVHDTFQKGAIEDISEDFISQVSEGFTVSSIKVYKQCNVICGEVAFTGELTEDGVVMFIKSKYAPLADVSTPLLTNLTDASAFYFDEGRNVLISKTLGAVMAGAYQDNQGFTKEFKFNFTYLC